MHDPMNNHKCKMIAKAPHCEDGREIWMGELLEDIEGHPEEIFCLHIKTPYKEIVLGLNMGDLASMAVFSFIGHGMPFNAHWLESMARRYVKEGADSDG